MAVALMASCAKENNAPANDGNEIRFGASMLGIDSRAALADNAVVLPSGDKIGIFAVKHTGTAAWTAAPYMNNVAGTVAANGTDITYSPTSYYPVTSTEKLNFYGYYPHSATVTTGAAAPTVAVTQPLSPADHTDYLYATPVADQIRQSSKVNLAFQHAFRLVRVKIQKNALMTDALELQSITLTTSSNQAGTMNIATGAITTTAAGQQTFTLAGLSTTVPEQSTTSGEETKNAVLGGTNARFLYVPGSTITGVKVVINGMDYEVTNQSIAVPAATTANGAIDIIVTVQPTGIIFTASVAKWTPGTETEITPN